MCSYLGGHKRTRWIEITGQHFIKPNPMDSGWQQSSAEKKGKTIVYGDFNLAKALIKMIKIIFNSRCTHPGGDLEGLHEMGVSSLGATTSKALSCVSPNVPHLFVQVPPEVYGESIIASYFHIERPDAAQLE